MEITNLITSPFGIGTELIFELLKRGETVYTIFPSPKDVPMSFLGKINLKYGFIKFDQELSIEKNLPRKAKNIFHTYENYTGPFTRVFMANVSTTLLLLEWAKKIGVEKFIFVSTGEVYGYGSDLNESAPYNPRSFYATTKFHAETLCRYYIRNFDIKILRLFFPFGKDLTQGYIYNLIETIKSTGIIETDYATLCPTFIGDVIEPMINLRDLPGSITYNLCGKPISVEQLIKEIETTIGKNSKKIKTGKIVLSGNSEKAKKELNYKETPLKDALNKLTKIVDNKIVT